MRHETTHDPAFSMLRVDLEPGEVLVAEAGAMVAMTSTVQLEAKLNAGSGDDPLAMLKAAVVAAIKKLLGGESFFVNHYSAREPATVWLAPTLSGSVVHRELTAGPLTLSSGAYLASTGRVQVDVRYGGLRGLLAKEGAFFLRVSGDGDVWFNSYGGVEAVDVDGAYIVDNGHLVGWEGDLELDIRSAGGGLLGFLASGEGAVCELRGRGRVWIQTRNTGSVVSWLSPMLP